MTGHLPPTTPAESHHPGHHRPHDHGPGHEQGHPGRPDPGANHVPGHGADQDHAPDHDHEHEHAPGHEHDHDHGNLGARLTHLLRPHSHDPADSTDTALESSADGIRAVGRSLVVLLATSAVQAAVVLASGSVALLADTVHNLADALTALPLGLAFLLARRAASRRFGYGLGRVEDLAGLVVVLMIAGSALVAFVQSIRRLSDPAAVQHLPVVAAAGVVGFLGNEVVARYRTRVGRRIGSAALIADGYHARADGITSLGVVVGAAGVALGWRLADPVVGLVITVAILTTLVGAVRGVGTRLLDGVDPDLVGRAEQALATVPDVLAVPGVRLRWVGHRLRAEVDLLLPVGLDLPAAEAVADAARAALRRSLSQLDHVHVQLSAGGRGPA